MMSHEEHRRQPTGEEEDGEDEERDIEARTAVEALLALTSPTDYTHHTGYEEDYMMEPVGEGYPKTASGEKDEMEAYNTIPEEGEEEEEEMDMEEEDEEEMEEGGCVKVVQQPLSVGLGKPDMRGVRQVRATNEGGARVNEAGARVNEGGVRVGEIGVGEGDGGIDVSAGDMKDTSQSDEGLKQLRAFIQATEGRQENVVVKSVCDRGSGERRSVFMENRTAIKTQSEGQYNTHVTEKNGRGMVMLPNQSLKDTVSDGVTTTTISNIVNVCGGLTGKLSPSNKCKDNQNNQNMEREVVKSVSQGKTPSITGDLARYGEFQKTLTGGGHACVGESEKEKTQNEEEEGEDEEEEEEDDSSEDSESEAHEQRREVREGEREKPGGGGEEREEGKQEGSSDSSDSEGEENEEEDGEEEEDRDSDSSSSSSGSSSSSSNDSDSDGSASDSESENELKCTVDKVKEPNTAATENSVTKSVSSAVGGEKSEKKDSDVTMKPVNVEDAKSADKRRSSDPARVIQKARLAEPLKIPNVLGSSDLQKPSDKPKGNEQPKNIKNILPCKEETVVETKPLLHNIKDTKPLTQNTREIKPLPQNAKETKALAQNIRETKLFVPKTEKAVLGVKGRRKSCEVSEDGSVSLSVGCRDSDPMDILGKMSSDPERKNSANKDFRKDSSDTERKLSVDAKNCLTAKVVDAVTKTEKTTSINSSGGIKIPSDKEKLFNNNSISITKSQGNVNATNNSNNKKNSVIKSGTQASEVSGGPPKLVTKTSGASSGNSLRGSSQHSQVDLVQEVAAAFAQQLSSIQANQTRNGTKTQHITDSEAYKGCKTDPTHIHSPRTLAKEEEEEEEEEEGEEKGDSEIEDMFPIQAEVVMSEGSESGLEYESFGEQQQPRQPPQGDLSWCRKGSEVLDPSEKENLELMAYLKSYVNGTSEGELVEYPPPNNDLPPGGQDLTQWQLDGVRLPPFTPSVAPPSWLRLTIPAEGYRCQSCDDTFFIESSLVQHRERRSVWISLECGPCDAKLTFYNRCALKDHLRNHMLQGEEVDEETVEVRSLPLQLTRLLQPIVVPVPDSLRMSGKKVSRNLKSHGAVNKLPVLKPIGRCASSRLAEYQNDGGDGASVEEDQDDTADQEEGFRSPSDSKIPPGIKKLSPRKRTVRCYLCERMFHSVRELMAHMRTDQPYSDQRVECKKCQLVLPSVCAAKAHILTHPPANTSNISVCPECGSRCDGPREFVHHLNTCGHQYRRSGVVCTECQVCFFRSQDDFLTHWIAEHCAKSYECVVCHSTFESLVFHRCTSPGQQVLATFRCLLTCPLCSVAVQLHAQEEQDTNSKIRAHLAEAHPTIITRVHYVYKSKFCTNAFRSKDELRAHHDREHRRDNHYRTKTCTLHHEVLGYQHQYFSGQEPRNAFVTLPVALSAEELHEARIRDVPTVSSVIDKTLFPDLVFQEGSRGIKSERSSKNKMASKGSPKEGENKDSTAAKETPVKKDMDQLDKLRPKVCYRCGFYYADNKDFRRHKRTCEGESAERQCRMCGLTAVGEDFARHCLGHVQEGAILCIYCNGTQFTTAADLEQHFELHVHEQFSYPASCAFCCTSLPDVPTALAHINEEHDPLHIPFDTSEFECDKCGRRFHGERGLSVHIGRCTLGTATPTPASAGCRQCQVCTKALTPEMFGRHMVCHLEEGLLVCSLCDGRTLPSSMALLHHLEEHAAALAYPSTCPMCTFSMQDSTSALTHLKEEHGFGNLHCADCDMHFNFTYQLQRHTDIVHKICQYAKRRYICWICRAYDHVKKETLMNHFRTVHGLDRQQVDEKVMIRTRGQGTMPTSQFIPTKPLGSKENQALAQANKDAEAPPARTQRDKSKTSPCKSSSTGTDSPIKHSGSIRSPAGRQTKDSPLKTLTLIESPIKEDSSKTNASQTFPGVDGPPRLYNMEGSLAGDSSNSFTPSKVPPSMVAADGGKVKDKMKVLVKRLPNSILDEESRSKRRRMEGQKSEAEQENKEGIAKEERIKKKKKKKKKKAYKCPVCLFGTNFKDKMDAHVLKHKENGEDVVGEADGFVCRECGASFVVQPSLARHMFFAHKVKLHVSSGDKNKDSTGTEVKKEQSDDVKVEEREEVCIKEVKKEKVMDEKEESRTVAKRKVLRETVRKKMESESVKTRSELRSRRGETPTLRRKPPKTNPKRRPERTSSVTVTNKRKEDVSKRKATKEGSRKTSERQNVGIKREVEEEEEEEKLDNQCVVCKEEFTNAVELYSHLRTHGMAFLKLGRKARPLGLGKPPSLDR